MSEEIYVGKFLDLSDLSFNPNEFTTTNSEPTTTPSKPTTPSTIVVPLNERNLNQERYT